MFGFWGDSYLAQKPDIFRCVCSNRDRLGFYAQIQKLFLGQCGLLFTRIVLFQGCADKLEEIFRMNLLYFLIFALCTVVVGKQTQVITNIT